MKTILLIFVFVYIYTETISEKVVIKKEYKIKEKLLEFNDKNLLKYLIKLKIKEPYIVLAQAKLETGNFKSKIFKENNNLFGMKVPKLRETKALGTKYNHAYYYHWTDSVKDYLLWQQQKPYNLKYKDYYQYLNKRAYCILKEDYIRRLKSIK